VLCYAMPVFFLGLLLKLLFATKLDWFYSSGRASPDVELNISGNSVAHDTHIFILNALIYGTPDDVVDVLRTAKLYEPSVVVVEDIDTEAATGEDNAIDRLLDAFDGITAKGGKMVVVMTTNHLERIHKGMLRPGRFDAVLEIGSLDRNGVERLIKVIVPPSKLADHIDYDAVYEAMEGFYPAFVREALERAKTFAVSRLKGASGYTLSTVDLVKAAQSLATQLGHLNGAAEGERLPTLDQVIGERVLVATREAVHGTQLIREGAYEFGELSVPSLNGAH